MDNLYKMEKPELIETGDILYHVLGFKVSVAYIHYYEKKPPHKFKCRYTDKMGIVHTEDFKTEELRIKIEEDNNVNQ